MNTSNTIIEQDLQQVEHKLSTLLTGSTLEQNVNNMCLSVVNAGGKRIRPRIALLVFRALNHKSENLTKIIDFASALELLHTATLVHDDVIDKATIRRGVKTINDTSGNHAAILAGDYLFTRCFICLHGVNCNDLYHDACNAISSLVTGEINQLENQDKLDFSIEDYLQTIYCKTGALFELACRGVATINQEDKEVVSALATYGKELGIAFQVADDILDYISDTQVLGKTVGEDLLDGRVTLPLIYALKSKDIEHDLLVKAIENKDLKVVLDLIEKSDAIAQSYQFAQNAATRAKEALAVLEDSLYKQDLQRIVDLAISRKN